MARLMLTKYLATVAMTSSTEAGCAGAVLGGAAAAGAGAAAALGAPTLPVSTGSLFASAGELLAHPI